MRSIKELLQIMLDNQQLFEGGLCIWALNLRINYIITFEEKEIILKYIIKNDVNKRYKETGYWWKSNNIKPRLKWIKKHINLNN
jgi:hypothetical protein